MGALLIDRNTVADAIFARMGVSRIWMEGSADRLVLTPASIDADGMDSDYIDPDDYPDTTAYLNAIPGCAERLIESLNNPGELEDIPRPRRGHNV